VLIENPRWLLPQNIVYRFILENRIKTFFLETRNFFEQKLFMNNHWMAPYRVFVSVSIVVFA
jgi:hypothetical protein